MHLQDVVRRLHYVTYQPHQHTHLSGACDDGKKLFRLWRQKPDFHKTFLYHTFSGDGCDDCRRAVALRLVE